MLTRNIRDAASLETVSTTRRCGCVIWLTFMIDTMRTVGILFLGVLLIGVASAQQILAQVKTQTPQREQSDDVVRVKTELVQTDITVVDKRGRFIDGLRADDLELRVDSKLQSLSFFEEVAAGSVDEEKQLAAARKGDAAALAKLPKPQLPQLIAAV
jgi:hypothetical protein